MARKKLKDIFKQFDLFGKEIRFRTKSNEEFQSRYGAVLTFLIYSLVIVYAQMKVQKLYFRSDTTHQETLNRDAVPPDQKFTFKEMDFNVGITLFPNDYSHFINMTEVQDYVQFEAVYV